MDQKDITDQITAACSKQVFLSQDLTVTDQNSASLEPTAHMSVQMKWISSNSGELIRSEEKHSNGTWEPEAVVPLISPGEDSVSAFPSSELSLPEVCISTNNNSFEDDMNYELQQAYKIFTGFLLDKHKGITAMFLHPIGHHDAQHGIEGVQAQVQSQLRQSMCLRRIEEKFNNQEYESITEFVADFRLMLENCYRYYGVDHWISKQAQKLEIMLEQKLTLLSRVLREKTSLAVTSKGRFGAEEERGSGGTSTRRRQASRYLATIPGGGHESVMVRTLRQEEQQRVKEEKRQRELEKKEAEEMSAKEVEEWEQSLLSQASPHTVGTLWELPAIGHFLCLAQTALNLPEIVFFELERCLLMPRCSLLLSKVMSSLLSPPQRRATLQRRPALPYRRWESELRQRVMGWYRVVGASHNQPRRTEQLGLCHQFFSVLGEVSPLEEKPFHLLPFYQRVWLLKGLCDHVYETQKDVQDAVLAQPIHECRESILGYDSKENAYIHFPHFCGADLRIYCQSPSTPPVFPFPSELVRRVEMKPGTEGSDGVKSESDQNDTCEGGQMDTSESGDFGKKTIGIHVGFKKENGNKEDESRFKSSVMDVSQSESSDSDSCEDFKLDVKKRTNSLFLTQGRHVAEDDVKVNLKEEISDAEQSSKQEQGFLCDSEQIIKAETPDPCLNVAEHSYTGRSPSSSGKLGVKMEEVKSPRGRQTSPCLDCLKRNICDFKSPEDVCCCGSSRPATHLSSETPRNLREERADDKIWCKKKKRKKKRAREQLPGVKREQKHLHSLRPPPSEAAKSVVRKVTTTIKRKDKKKKYKTGKKPDSLKKMKEESLPAPSFKLVCSNLDELRELISKTEDELDELESMKKRLGRWYYKKEAVKELHSTLIRLLNELLPWEPKLVKAYQRNRLRLKKEYDDFKKHPEYNNFVREECVSSSSSSSSSDEEDDGYEETDVEKSHCRDLEEEDQEHVVPRGLWSGASTRESAAESAAEKAVTSAPSNHLKHPLTSKERGFALLPGVQGVFTSVTSADWRREARSGLISTSQSGDLTCAAGISPHTSVSPSSPIPSPTCKLPPGYTPIPTLLAKSVGNKVTLMRRPTDFPGVSTVDGQLKGSAVINPKVSKAQSFPSSGNQISQETTTKAQLQSISTGALPKTPQGTVSQTEPKSPVQVVCTVSEGVGHLAKKDSSSPVKPTAHSVVDKSTVEKVMQQVVFLPFSHLVQKNETKTSFVNPQQSNVLQVAVSKVATPVCISTDVPGFSIPDGKIPVQQVAPLTDARTPGNPAPSGSPFLQQRASNSARLKGAQVCTVKASTLKGCLPTPSTVTAATRTATAETAKFTEPKQELKTVCIRDSQSILVTTRGGNTGIVKVQASSEQNSLGSFPTSPVITISPQLKAFLVSKTSTLSASVPSHVSLTSVSGGTSTSVTQTQKHGPSVLTAPHTATISKPTMVTSSTPLRGIASKTTSTAAGLSRSSCISPVSTVVTKISQPVNTATCGSPFPPSTLKNKVVVPSLSSSSVSKVPMQEPISKTGVKRSSTDEIPQVTKYILVTSTSSASSNQPTSKGTPSSTQSAASSRVVRVSHPTVTTSTTFMGAIPKQMMGAGSGQALTTSLSSPTLKMGISPAKPVACVSSETLTKASNSALQAGVAVPLLGKTTTVGQTVGALSHSPSKASPVPISGTYCPTAATTAGLVPITNLFTITNCSSQLDTLTSLPAVSPIKGVPSTSVISQTRCSSSTAAILPAEKIKRTELLVPAATTLSSSSPAQVTTTMGNCPAQTSTAILDQKPLHSKSGMSEAGTPALSSSQTSCNKTHPPLSSAPTTFSTSTSGPVTQRIIINTSTHLTAGTQIVLNNACFVVPPQGLGPGSHVLLISNPAPQVPAVTSTSTEVFLPPKGTSPAIVSPQAPSLSQSAARLPSMPSAGSPFAACTGQSLLAGTPHVTLFRPPGLGSSVIPSKTNVVSALPRLPPAHGCNFGLPPVCTSTLISSPPRLSSVPVLASPVKTTTPSLGSALTTVRVTGGSATQTNCSSTITSAVSTSLSRLSGPLSPLHGLLSSSTGALHNPVTPLAAASIVTNPAVLHCSPSGQRVDAAPTLGSIRHPEHTRVNVVTSLSVQPQGLVQTGPGKMPLKTALSVVQPVLSGARTQELPTVAVPPILSPATRTQALPIATVPPIGSTISTFEMASAATSPPLSTTLITPAPPVTSLMTKSTISPPIILTNQALRTNSVQTSVLGMHANLPPKLLTSTDGAVLSTAQCQVNQPEMTEFPKPQDTLVGAPNSSGGVLRTHDSTLQPLHRDTK
ncbi:putative bromodomain-containing protein 10 [Anableps anableps]